MLRIILLLIKLNKCHSQLFSRILSIIQRPCLAQLPPHQYKIKTHLCKSCRKASNLARAKVKLTVIARIKYKQDKLLIKTILLRSLQAKNNLISLVDCRQQMDKVLSTKQALNRTGSSNSNTSNTYRCSSIGRKIVSIRNR